MTQKSMALRKARALIAEGKQEYICRALQIVGRSYYIQQEIMNALYPCAQYSTWVAKKHPRIYKKMLAMPDAFRQGRLQWLDYLIAQEEGK